MTTARHVIWDWNGTLLDDYEITAGVTLAVLADLGAGHVGREQMRHQYRRPLKDYFSSLLGRDVTAAELQLFGSRYEEVYGAALLDLPLAADAVEALDMVGRAASQSILSMAPHGQLNTLIDHHGLRAKFRLVQGHRADGHPAKRDSLVDHCAALQVPVERCCLIGDAADDFDAAASLGLPVILVTTGVQSRERLEETGAPVVGSLREAAALFLARSAA